MFYMFRFMNIVVYNFVIPVLLPIDKSDDTIHRFTDEYFISRMHSHSLFKKMIKDKLSNVTL